MAWVLQPRLPGVRGVILPLPAELSPFPGAFILRVPQSPALGAVQMLKVQRGKGLHAIRAGVELLDQVDYHFARLELFARDA
jgi:hypothetical protein